MLTIKTNGMKSINKIQSEIEKLQSKIDELESLEYKTNNRIDYLKEQIMLTKKEVVEGTEYSTPKQKRADLKKLVTELNRLTK